MLAAQAVISIENALLYASLEDTNRNLERKVLERTQELRQKNHQVLRTQKQLMNQERMASLGTLTAGVAHEINTPVGVGMIAASFLNDQTLAILEQYEGGELTEGELERFLSGARESGRLLVTNLKRASELIQSFKKVAVDQTSEERRVFKVKPYLEEVLLSLAGQLRDTQHSVSVQGPEGLEIDSFPGCFAQIVANMVGNSLAHAFDEGASGKMEFILERQEQEWVLRYRDNGSGIPAEDQRKIFDPFFTTQRGSGRLGLGLHVVYNVITQRLNGQITCESEPGKGVTFCMRFPL